MINEGLGVVRKNGRSEIVRMAGAIRWRMDVLVWEKPERTTYV